GGGGQTPAMTCVGLLGLGIGHGSFNEAVNGSKKGDAAEKGQTQMLVDPAIENGLKALGQFIGAPTGIRGPKAPVPGMVKLYSLWSVERVAILYNLKTIGAKDWSGWGSELLRTHQAADGSWMSGGFPGSNPITDTCMALLFLKRSNLTRDLSDNLP